ncbi:helix-turn-helix domain-containing protein [Sphingosinicella sp. CPCC 101087]|uniref:helix-turn-helix domain-containing protein n=1 Tax=Sphingosinicella sp. CPCC 101087 TaxID=2497754 RepID=UPI00101D4EC8|nr:helix-turn-helix domain-containing protein [Sphingosinicella sp. CPCC 101087]
MQRATKIFHLEARETSHSMVRSIWRTTSAPHPSFISVAAAHWLVVFWKQDGRTHVTVRGPETRASAVPIPADAQFMSVEFRPGTFLPDLPVHSLVDGDVTLRRGVGNAVRLNGSVLEIPTFDDIEAFVGRLVREGLLVDDPAVRDALQGRPVDLSRRSVERRVRRATGLTLGAIRQIERARKAAALLDGGATIFDAVMRAGYSDQAHLTRSLKRFVGQTPAQIAREAR